MRKLIFIWSFLAIMIPSLSQELYCTVQINTQQVTGTDKKVFETMEKAIFEFMNNRKWTNYNYEIEERIECTILITISQRISSDVFKGSLNIILKRPIYNTSYNSTTLNYVDRNFLIEYVEFQPLEFNENVFTTNLTQVLAYYVYIFLAIDFDTYALYGGTPYYEKAEAIVSASQNVSYEGWKPFENQKNRYWLVENLMNPAYKPIRKFFYEYHRQGLDLMFEDTEKGRSNILQYLKYLENVRKQRPGLFLLQVVIDAKRDEFINIFSEGSPAEKIKAVNILKVIDPANVTKYEEILGH
jgi:hypothetical protein